MKIGMFTDAHYSSAELTCGKRYNSQSLRKIREAYRYFEEGGCELVIFLGDLTDTENSHEEELRKLKEAAEAMTLPTVCMMGNHDAFDFTEEEFYSIVGEDRKPSHRTISGKRLLFLDACYFADGRRYAPGDSDWTDTFYPFEDELKHELQNASLETLVFLHQNIDPTIPEDHCLSNAAELRTILENSGTVSAVYQGHYHPGKQTEHNGIQYITLPAMCEREKARWIIEI